jgi:AcrR family transcriptional regulator
MSKTAAIDALIEAAIHHFARHGYEGSSLRDIANEAGAPLSTIDRYFGSKAELFRAVLRHVWSEVERDRDLLLEQSAAQTVASQQQLSDLIYALARPIVQRALSKQEGDVARTWLLLNVRQPEAHNAVRSLSRWIDAMALTCPTLSRQDLVWTFSYFSGLIYSRQLIHHQYDTLFTPEGEPTVESVTGDIVAFGCAGTQAIIERRAAAAKPSLSAQTRLETVASA